MALTEWYVTDSGVGDGSAIGTPMSLATFHDHMVTGGAVNAVAGARYNIKAGSYASRTTTTDTWVNGGNVTSPVIVRGYGTTPGDGYLGRDTAGALITTNMPTLTYGNGGISISGNFIILEAVQVVTGRSNYSIIQTGTDNLIRACVVSNSSTSASAGIIQISGRSIAFDCDFNMTGASGGLATGVTQVNGVSVVLDSCRIKVVPTVPVVGTAGSAVIYGNTIYGSGGVGIVMHTVSGAPFIRNNTIVGCAGDGIEVVTGTTGLQRIIGNMITDCGGFGIDMVIAGNAGVLAYNRLRGNSSSINLGTDWVAATSYGQGALDTGTTGTTATDYVNFAANNFNLVSGSPAISAGIPAKASIGALQRDQTGAGGSSASSFTFAQ